MGLLMSQDLKQIIPMIEDNISQTEAMVKSNPNDEGLQNLLQSQQELLEEYKKRINVWTVE